MDVEVLNSDGNSLQEEIIESVFVDCAANINTISRNYLLDLQSKFPVDIETQQNCSVGGFNGSVIPISGDSVWQTVKPVFNDSTVSRLRFYVLEDSSIRLMFGIHAVRSARLADCVCAHLAHKDVAEDENVFTADDAAYGFKVPWSAIRDDQHIPP